MCFATAKLPAPAADKKVTKTVSVDAATYTVKAVSRHVVQLRLGKRESEPQFAQNFTPEGLREFARQLNVLANELAA